jgi:Fic family protein
LLERAAALVGEAHRLEASARGLVQSLAPLLRTMNSYYTNKIEGQHTRPADIERALEKDFDRDADNARKQRLAVAHVRAEMELEDAISRSSIPDLYTVKFVQGIHSTLYGGLPPEDRITSEGAPVEPGAFRVGDVTAGRHLAPAATEIGGLLGSWGERYSGLPGLEQAVVGAACSHHRLLWIHPFSDGNGRTARLHTHLVLTALGLTQGVWSPLRGMARDQQRYYASLNNADLPRRNDLDGRGALSQEGLVEFAGWLLDTCLDQARFMRDMLDFDALKGRIADVLSWLAAHPFQVGSERSVVKLDALEALHYVALVGPVERARFLAMTGLPPRTARRVLSSLLEYGLLVSASSRAEVTFSIPLPSLRFLFPRLWPEAERGT